MYDLVVIGGGAAGFFTAINATNLNRSLKVLILEKNNEPLQKVKVSGGGRCNVTHHCYEPELLIKTIQEERHFYWNHSSDLALPKPYRGFQKGEWLSKRK